MVKRPSRWPKGSYSQLRTVARALKVPRLVSAFPQQRLVNHKYCDNITIAAAGVAGLYQVWQFRANSTYDPDYTGTGHQPMFRDELAAQYNYYTVMASRIEILVQPAATTGRTMALFCDDDTTYPTTSTNFMEQHGFIAAKLDKRNTPLKLTGWYNAAKWNKTTNQGILADADQKIAVGSNPTAPVAKYFTFLTFPDNTGSTLDAFTFTVKIYYTVMWREPVDHVGS